MIGTGNSFIIEKWNGKNWVKEKQTTNRIFTSIGYEIKPDGERAFETEVFAYYPDLTNGRFRISKSYFYDKDRPITQNEVHWIYGEFTIN